MILSFSLERILPQSQQFSAVLMNVMINCRHTGIKQYLKSLILIPLHCCRWQKIWIWRMNMKQGLQQSREDGDERTRCFSFVDLILLLVSVIVLLSYLHILHQSIFKVIITVLIEHLHCFFHRKTDYHQ